MNTNKLKPNTIFIVALILIFAIFRVTFPGFKAEFTSYTPLGAIAIFGGSMLSNRFQSILIPVAIMFLSDVVINAIYYGGSVSGIFHDTWFAVYGAFALMAIASRYIMKKVTVANTLISAIVATLIHWIVTDTAVWALGYKSVAPIYTQDFAGLVNCHIAAIPFEQNFLIGTLAYSAILFGVFYLVKQQKPSLALAK
jgi:hypothetical protein